jgi:aldehyde:ferredoxin oxidoreductase
MRILRANMKTARITLENLREDWMFLGGRGLIAKILNREPPLPLIP